MSAAGCHCFDLIDTEIGGSEILKYTLLKDKKLWWNNPPPKKKKKIAKQTIYSDFLDHVLQNDI